MEENTLLRQLTNLGYRLQESPSEYDAYRTITRSLGKIFPDSCGAISLISEEEDANMEAVAVWGYGVEYCKASSLAKQPHYAEDINYEEVFEKLCDEAVAPPNDNVFQESLVIQGVTLGEFRLWNIDAASGNDNDLIARALAQLITLSISNLRLRENVKSHPVRDPMTALFNRRYMEESLERELHRAKRNDKELGVILVEANNLKPINNNHGMDAGDKVLRCLAGLFQATFRGTDIPCRYNGHSFVLILPDCNLENLRRRADQLIEMASGLHIHHQGEDLEDIAVVIGISSFPEHGSSSEDLLLAAESAAFRARKDPVQKVQVAERAE